MNAIQGVYRSQGFARSTIRIWLGYGLVAVAAAAIIRWGVWDAKFSASGPGSCRLVSGACWSVITTQWKLVLLGTYPMGEIWRPLVVTAILVTTFMSGFVRPDLRTLAISWSFGIAASIALLDGRAFGLAYVETLQWGGLPLTLLLTQSITVLSFPLALLLALTRSSESGLLSSVSLVLVECVRGVPLVSLLFFATLVLPLFLSGLSHLDKLLAATLAITIFNAAYISEVIRGGLLTVPSGQFEAARSLGFRWAKMQRLIVLPQALKACAPSLVNHAVGIIKDTALVAVIGIFDLMNSAKFSLTDINWREYYFEVYMLVGLSYFLLCSATAFLCRKISSKYFTV